MKILRQIFIYSSMFCISFLQSGFCANIPCIEKIGADTDFIRGLSVIVGKTDLRQTIVDEKPAEFYKLFDDMVWKYCSSHYRDLNQIADSDDIIIPFTFAGQKFEMQMKTDRLFDENKIKTAFLVYNSTSKIPGDIVKKTDMPTDWFFNTKCSTHHPRWNVDNTDPINTAGQVAFSKYIAMHNNAEFFLDQPVTKTCRAFPGIVRGDFNSFYGSGTGGDYVNIITYDNYQDARRAFKTFAAKLQGTNCRGQGLSAYHVSIQGENTTAQCGIEKVIILSNPEPIN